LWSRFRSAFTRRMWIMLAITGGIILLLVIWTVGVPYVFMNLLMPKGGFVQAQTVSTVRPQKLMWQTQIHSVGTLHAVEGSDLAAELAGTVVRIGFKPGQDVKKGTLLVQLNDDSDRAQLAALRASAELATQTYIRYRALLQSNAISRQQYDSAFASMKNARALTDTQSALVAKKSVHALFDGRVGIRTVDVGQYVTAGQVVVTLQQLDPIYVDFTVPQQQISALKTGYQVSLVTDAVPGRVFIGRIDATDSKADSLTRNVRVRALVNNPDKMLLPGMFASVVTEVGAAHPLLTLPQTAITYNPYGDTVFVVVKQKQDDGKETLIAEQRFITLGETRGDQVAVLSGLTARDVVVSNGQIKLKNGTPVIPNNAVHLPNDPAPTPIQQ
jgi:membrane fusion protein, multidrug efflux system